MAETPTRRRRAHGEESRRKILDAAAEVAGERGYEGTSIALVSTRSGLPASSIYWHFADKDELIAAVIRRSFDDWRGKVHPPDGEAVDDSGPREEAATLGRKIALAMPDSPDFLRLGLMLILERRPEELAARRMVVRTRAEVDERLRALLGRMFPALDDESIRLAAVYALAGADGLFIAREAGGAGVDLVRLFEMHVEAVTRLCQG